MLPELFHLIKELKNRGHDIITCGDEVAKNILNEEFKEY